MRDTVKDFAEKKPAHSLDFHILSAFGPAGIAVSFPFTPKNKAIAPGAYLVNLEGKDFILRWEEHTWRVDPLKDALKVVSIDLGDGGDCVTTGSRIAEHFLLNVREKAPATVPIQPPEFKPLAVSKVPIVNANALKPLLKDAASFETLGRTVYFRGKDGNYIALKVLKTLPGTLANLSPAEDAGKLLHESRWFEHIQKLKQQGVVLDGDAYPKPVLIDGQPVFRMREQDIPEEIRSRIRIAAADIPASPEENTVHKDADGCCTFMAYSVKDATYMAYAHQAKTTRQARAALGKNVHDLFTWARFDWFHPDIIELFHRRSRRDRWDSGRFILFADIVRPREGVIRDGVGRLYAWELAMQYPNLRLQGPADFAEMVELKDLEDLTNEHSAPLHNNLARFPLEQRRKFLRAHFMSNYLLACAFEEGKRLKDAGKLDWRKPQELAETLKGVYWKAYKTYTGKDATDISEPVDWERYARQMAFFMSGAYKEYAGKEIPEAIYGMKGVVLRPGVGWGHVHRSVLSEKLKLSFAEINGVIKKYLDQSFSREGDIPEDIYVFKRDFPKLIETERDFFLREKLKQVYEEYSRGWRFDGMHDDLGSLNGPFPLQELVKANYDFTMFMVAQGPQKPANGGNGGRPPEDLEDKKSIRTMGDSSPDSLRSEQMDALLRVQQQIQLSS